MSEGTRFFILGGVLFAILAGLYGYSRKAKTSEEPVFRAPNDVENEENTVLLTKEMEGVSYTYRGVVRVPTPCHGVVAEALILESYPEQVHLKLAIINPAPDTLCAQVVSDKEFAVTVSVSPKHSLSVFVNGKRIPFRIIPKLPADDTTLESPKLLP